MADYEKKMSVIIDRKLSVEETLIKMLEESGKYQIKAFKKGKKK